MNAEKLVRKLLIVDDLHDFLTITKFGLEKDFSDLSVTTIGPNNDESDPDYISAGENALKFIQELDISEFYSYQCIIIDSNMPGMSGLDLARKIISQNRFAPVVLLTGAENHMSNIATESFEDGARGFLFKSSKSFFPEIYATTRRVYSETTRERWLSVISEVANLKITGKNAIKEYSQTVLNIIYNHFPGTVCFIRNFRQDGQLELLSSMGVDENTAKDLELLQPEEFPFIKSSIDRREPEFDNFAYTWPDNKFGKAPFNKLGLDRAYFMPLISRDQILGSFSFYKKRNLGFFLKEEEKYTKTLATLISSVLFSAKYDVDIKQQGTKISEIVTEFNKSSSEKEIFDILVNYIHNNLNFNQIKDTSVKTTIKVIPPGANDLRLASSKGKYRKSVGLFKSELKGSGVSGFVAATGKPKLVRNCIYENIWISTNENSVSSITTPLYDEDNRVIAVLNSENSAENYFGYEDLSLANILSHLAASFVNRKRTNEFLDNVLSIVSKNTNSDDLLKELLSIIKKFCGFEIVIVALKTAKGIYAPIIEGYNQDEIKIIREKFIDTKDPLPLVVRSLLDGKEYFWQKDDSTCKINPWFPNPKKKSYINSQYTFLFKLLSGEPFGVFSLEFKICNALSARQINTIHKILPLFARLLSEAEEHKILEEEAHRLRTEASFVMAMRQISHNLNHIAFQIGHLSSRTIKQVENGSDKFQIINKLLKIQNHAQQLEKYKTNLRALTGEIKNECIDIRKVIDRSIKILSEKVSFHKINLQIFIDENQLRINTDRNILEVVFMNIVDNSINALQKIDEKNRKILIYHDSVDENFLDIYFEDSGNGLEGISKEEIFTEFKTTNSSGTGIGLSFSKSRLRKINSKIDFCKSRYLPGASFRIQISNLLTEL